jgi:hypothetical protein
MQDESSTAMETRLSVLLREARPNPDLPPGFCAGVWARLDQGEALPDVANPEVGSWWERWLGWLGTPRVAAAGLAVVVVTAGFAGAVSGAAQAREQARDRYLAAVAPRL